MLGRIVWLAGGLVVAVALLAACMNGLAQADAFAGAGAGHPVIIDAVYYDGYEKDDADEAIALRGMGDGVVELAGWSLGDGEATTAVLPGGSILPPGEIIWITKDGDSFRRQFGFTADVTATAWPRLANRGDEVILRDAQGELVDVVVYGAGDTMTAGWEGPAVQPYSAGGLFAGEGQILYRTRDQVSGLPEADTDSAADWAQTLDDPLSGRRARYPGWDLDAFQRPLRVSSTAALTVAIAPDNALETVVALLDGATSSISLTSLTIENEAVGEALAAAARRGVAVKVLLEGSPVGGITAQEKFLCREIERAGGQCWFMIRDDEQRIHDRYRYMHAKYIVVDRRQVAISSENFSPNSMPADEKTDGTWGRRGVVLITDERQIVARVQEVFAADLDPDHHADIFRWREEDSQYGAPPSGNVSLEAGGGISYTVRYPQPSVFNGEFVFELQQSPENSLRDADGYLHLIDRAREGDTIYVQQLQERAHWGASGSEASSDPNPRLERFIAAARRGARVRFLLDSFFDEAESELSNAATCRYVNQVAREEALDLACSRANPTGLGIHNKMILAQVGGRGYVHIGSLNGTELASKGNRELTLLVQSDGAYELLADMFTRDMPHVTYTPLNVSAFRGPANHVLISEVLYDPYGADEVEFVELVNPDSIPLAIGGYSLSDAVSPNDYEDLRRFPQGTVIAPGETLVVATSGFGFWQRYGRWPEFEILETTEQVANLQDDPAWGETSTFFRLGNQGDEVILRDLNDRIVDALAYGEGAVSGETGCALLPAPDHSLERFPYWRDTGSCTADFRDWPFPSPGTLPDGGD